MTRKPYPTRVMVFAHRKIYRPYYEIPTERKAMIIIRSIRRAYFYFKNLKKDLDEMFAETEDPRW